MYDNVMRGADPELFLMDMQGNPVTSIGKIGGTKMEPRDIGGGYAVQEDNVSVEFNIPPAGSRDVFVAEIHHVLAYLEEYAKQMNLQLNIQPTAEFSEEQLSHPQAQELGCEPDFCAWTLKENPRPTVPKLLRSSGWHLHLSWKNPKMHERIAVIRAHDLFCGTASLLHDNNTLRRSIYGKAGAFRSKHYGVEWRTASKSCKACSRDIKCWD